MRRGKRILLAFLLLGFSLVFLNGFRSSTDEGVIYDDVEFSTAIKEFERIVQNEPENKKAREILLMLKKRREEKRNAQLYYDQAMEYYRAGNLSKAYDALEKAKSYDPVNPLINKKIEEITQKLVGKKRFTLKFKDESLKNVLLALSQVAGVNILLPEEMEEKVSVELKNLTFQEALDKVLKDTNYTYEKHKDYIKIIPIEEKIVKESFSKKEKIYNTSFKEFAFQDVLVTLGKMMKINIILDDSVADLADKKVNLYIQEMTIWDTFQLILKMFDVTYAKFNSNTYIIMTKDRYLNSEYNEEHRKHMFFPVTNIDPKYIVDLISKTPGFKEKINPKHLIIVDREGKGLKESTRIKGILAYETPENLKSIKALIDKIDVKRKQVIISVRMMEVSRQIFQKLGLDIDFNPTGANDSEYDKVIDPKIFQNFRAKLIRRGGTAISTDKLVLSATLDFLEKQDLTKTIASPSIRTLDGEKASINIVSSKPVQYAKPITATNAQGQPTIEVTYDWQTINYGVKLEVEPIIHEDGEITMKLNISKDAPSNKVEGLDNTFRYESSSNSIDTIVRVKDGETVIMGGLISKQRTVNKQGVPFFKKLPVIGKLFEHQEVSDPENKELVIFITPYLVNNNGKNDSKRGTVNNSLFAKEYKSILKELNEGEM